MTTIRKELEPYLEILTEKLKGKYFILNSSVFKIHKIKLSSSVLNVGSINAIVENLKTKEIHESDWAFLTYFNIFEFESDEAALLYKEIREEE